MTLLNHFKHTLQNRLHGRGRVAYVYKLSITLFAMAITAFANGQVIPTLPAKQKPTPPVKHTAPAAQQPTAQQPAPKPAAPKQDETMVLVQGGSFSMGSNDGGTDEKPVHTVTVGSFYISKYELTVAEFKKFVDEANYATTADQDGFSWLWDGSQWVKKNGVNWRCGSDGAKLLDFEMNKPVVHVSYNDAVKYCEWKSYKTGKTYRLPTEAEWEYAARGGNKSNGYTYSGSNNIDEVAWYTNNSGGTTHPVGQKQPNELGLYDMTGNVWEWCSDWYDDNYYGSSPAQNPQGPSTGSYRVIRGGSWSRTPLDCRAAGRNYDDPGDRNGSVGFRPVVSF